MESASASKKISLSEYEGDFDRATAGYQPFRIGNLLPGSPVPFNVFFPAKDGAQGIRFRLIFGQGDLVEKQSLDALREQEVDAVYIRDEDGELQSKYLAENIKKVLTASVPVEEKAGLLYNHAEFLVEKAFCEDPSIPDIELGIKLVRSAAMQFAEDEVSVQQLFSIFSRDYHTYTHSVQVGFLSMAFATYLGWLKGEVADVGAGALFHDVGKSEIDEAILQKPGRLTALEFDEVRKHSRLGYNRLKKSHRLSPDQLDIVLHHHEDVTGGGYPDGLKGKAIHKYAKIVRIVDCYDALTTKRPYKDAVSQAEALRVMKEEMQGSFDPYYLDAFTAFCGVDTPVHVNTSQGKRIAVEMESYVQLQFRGSEQRLKSRLVGMETGWYLVVRLPKTPESQEKLFVGNMVIVRYICSGTIYGFQSTIMSFTEQPLQLLVLSYPEKVEQHELRRHKRVDCLLPGKVTIMSMDYPCMVADLSVGGCRFVSNVPPEDEFLDDIMDEELRLSFELPGTSGAQTAKGKVRNVRREGSKLEVGIQFFEVDQVLYDRLKNFIQNSLCTLHP